jgi:hypothetical protein
MSAQLVLQLITVPSQEQLLICKYPIGQGVPKAAMDSPSEKEQVSSSFLAAAVLAPGA